MIHFDYGHPFYFHGVHWLGWLFLIFATFVCLVYFLIFLWFHLDTDKKTRQELYRKAGYDPKKALPWWAWIILFAFTYLLISQLTILDKIFLY